MEIKRQPFEAQYNRHRHPRQSPALFQVSIVGPLDEPNPDEKEPGVNPTPSRERILVCNPQLGNLDSDNSDAPTDKIAMECGEKVLSALLRRAYRREVEPADLESPMWFFEQGLREGGFEAGVEAALTSVLVNPNFLFRVEREPADAVSGKAYQINDFELASRLSYFLWSSMPDDQLLDLARRGELRQAKVLEKQVLRILQDPKANSLVTNFASQWLYLKNLDSITPDLRLFPDFDDNLRVAFRRETQLLFADVVSRDGSVLGLIDSDFTFLNERLATHYEIPHVRGSHFRRVDLNDQSDAARRRGGLLRHGSVLTVTSYATRTSPTIRGHWILKNILGTPPPPPPANVPNLKEKSTLVASSIRERLTQHREDPACASCHNLMDPMGFAFENYDALGRWRQFDGTLPIDSRGSLPDGREIDNVSEIEADIMERPQLFVGTLAEKLLTFALGRGMSHEDGPAIREIVSLAEQHEFRFSTLVQAITRSRPFQMRLAE
jgi:hypothetical protein